MVVELTLVQVVGLPSCGRVVDSRARRHRNTTAGSVGIQLAQIEDATEPIDSLEPDGRNLGHREPAPAGLGDQLDAHLEAGVGLDADCANECAASTP